jgi:hypothetical protein
MRGLLAALCVAATTAPALAQQCSIEYQRADNMLAAAGRPDGSLGKETLTLQAGETRAFNTDWKYEKQRNDGRNYYGSHMRIVRNTGQRPVRLTFRGNAADLLGAGGLATKVAGDRGTGELKPGATAGNLRADLMEVACPAADKDARASGPTPGGTPNAALTPPPTRLVARQVSPTEVVLDWKPVPGAKEYRVNVSPPGRSGVVGGNGGHYVIPLPRNLSTPVTIQASIQTVAANGSLSAPAQFNPVQVMPVATTGGGTPSGPGTSPGTSTPTSGPAGQQCPPGQFVTGFTGAGALICAAPTR